MEHPPQAVKRATAGALGPPKRPRIPGMLTTPRTIRRALAALAVLPAVVATPAAAGDRAVLAIGAHAGDAEITTGALLARHKRLGDRVALLHLTLGEGGNPKMSPAAYGEQKKREALVAAKVLGADVFFGPGTASSATPRRPRATSRT